MSILDDPALQNGQRWWLADTDEGLNSELWGTIHRLRSRQAWRMQSDELSLRLYSDMRMVGYRSNHGTYEAADVLDARMGENIIRNIVRTLHSKAIRHRPKPVVLTEGASWKLKHKAELLDTWINGKLFELKADTEIFPAAILFSLVLGTGVIRSYGDSEKGARLEVVPTYEVIVDDSEARYGTPRSIYMLRVADRNVLASCYPDKEEILKKAGSAVAQREWAELLGRWDSERSLDLIVTIEAFHLPSGPGAKDGRHVITCDSGPVVNERWTRDHFPLAFVRGERRPLGFWGIGVPEDLAGAQLELNRTILARQEMIRLLAVPFWLVERGSKVVKSHISNLIGRVVEFTGTPPQLITPNSVPQEIWTHSEQLKKGMFESRGVSQLSAQAIKPAGLNSGRAIRTYTDLESELLVDLLRSYEQLVLDCANLLIEEQGELGKKFADQAVTSIGRGGINKIKWSEAQMDPEDFRIKIVPASSLSATVSGRIEDVFDLKDLGVVTDPEEIRELLDMPDLKRQKNRTMAHRELLEKIIEQKILVEGIWIQPESFWDLKLAIKLGLQALNESQLFEDIDQENLEMLMEWIDAIRELLSFGEPTPLPPVGPQPEMAEAEGLPGAPLPGGVQLPPAMPEAPSVGGMPVPPPPGGLPPG
jgi:hypothetical protein